MDGPRLLPDSIPRGIRLTAYSGGAADLPANVLQGFLDAVAAGEAIVPIHSVYQLDEIRQAHAEMEAGSAIGKIVVLTAHGMAPRTHH
jgi:NADPH:quinone reductase